MSMGRKGQQVCQHTHLKVSDLVSVFTKSLLEESILLRKKTPTIGDTEEQVGLKEEGSRREWNENTTWKNENTRHMHLEVSKWDFSAAGRF